MKNEEVKNENLKCYKNVYGVAAHFLISIRALNLKEEYVRMKFQSVAIILVDQSCPSLCDPMDCSPPGSSLHGIFQPKILEWVAIPSPGDLPNPGIKPGSAALQTDSLPIEL